MPSNWAAEVGGRGVVSMGLSAGLERGFWERYFDGHAEAAATYERELAAILAES